MKKVLIYISCAAAIALGGCTKSFDSINTNPTAATGSNFGPNLLLPTAEIGLLNAPQGYNGNLLFQSMWAQVLSSASFPTYYSNGDKYVASTNLLTYDESIWSSAYGSATNCYEIQNLTKGISAYNNLAGIALIIEFFNIELITDVYGDCPYSQALQAKAGVNYPAYDSQQSIYASILSRLDSVQAALDPSANTPKTSDIIYGGNMAEWKKLANSLMLRMAMRLTKVDPTTAQTYAEKAYANGVFTSIADNAFVTFDHNDGYNNGNASAYIVPEDFSEVRWAAPFISFLKSTNDPRLAVIAEVPLPGKANAAIENLAGDNTIANQLGQPSGYDQNGAATDISTSPGYPGPTGTGNDANPIGKYSRPSIALYTGYNTPAFLMTYAETELLLSEAAVRGWNVGASASVHYANGVSAALQSLATMGGTAIGAGAADTYAAANPLDVSSTDNSLAMINTQYWATTGSFFNGVESWINWRRSGYPVLTPVNYPANFTGGQIPRREIYPGSEAVNNPAALKAAQSALSGGDNWTSHVYWDK
ncbi:MAG: SusD/RagB family nutrient-binding outer membrane lipoprotein [Puia sp.]|nr:SusD/RagB family nutrient-binding outer membrane lipoprotein [Puia sp.]